MTPRITSTRFPYLPMRLRVRELSYEGEALLDTGFDGGVVMPAAFFSQQASPDWHVWWSLADNRQTLAPVYRGTVELDGLGPLPVLITAIGDEPIIGLGVINRIIPVWLRSY